MSDRFVFISNTIPDYKMQLKHLSDRGYTKVGGRVLGDIPATIQQTLNKGNLVYLVAYRRNRIATWVHGMAGEMYARGLPCVYAGEMRPDTEYLPSDWGYSLPDHYHVEIVDKFRDPYTNLEIEDGVPLTPGMRRVPKPPITDPYVMAQLILARPILNPT